jgi:hypothetical protein
MLVLMVLRSPNFTIEWFLDGRRIPPAAPYEIPPEMTRETRPPMEGPQGRRSIET